MEEEDTREYEVLVNGEEQYSLWLAGQQKAKPQRAPSVGEHSDEVLREAGFPEAEIRILRTEGVIG